MRITKTTYTDIVSALLVTLFTYAALSKLFDYGTFRFQLQRSPYITKAAGLIAWSLPAIELLISLLLIQKTTRLIGLYASFILMLSFTVYVYAMLHFSYFLPCSCGGVLSSMSWHQHLLFNSGFTSIALIGIIFQLRVNPKASLTM